MNSTIIDITSFIVNIAQRDSYQSLVFVSSVSPIRALEDGDRSLIEDITKATGIPFISLTYVSSINITNNFNIELLTIVDLHTKLYDKILEKIRQLLHLTAQARIVLIMDEDTPNPTLLQAIFEDCWRKYLVNVIAIFRDFKSSLEFYSYEPYPVLHTERMSALSTVIFPDRLKDLKGTALTTFADQLTPTNMMILKPDGGIELTGYAGHIVNAFKRKHNAMLNFSVPYELGKTAYGHDVGHIIFNETIDMFVRMSSLNISALQHSYTVEQTHYCLMLPVEEDLPTALFYKIILQAAVILAINVTALILGALLVTATCHYDKRKKFNFFDILYEKTTIRGLYAQTFKFPSSSSPISMFVCILISLLGMQISTAYVGHLQSYFMHPPTQRKVRTYDDLHWAPYKVLLLYTDGGTFLELVRKPIDVKVGQLTNNFTEFMTAMEGLNTTYAYVVPTSKWNVLKGKQEWFAKPLFRLTDLCPLVGIQLGFPMHPNSVLKNALNRVIMQVTDSGLLKHWVDRTFYEMVEIGQMTFDDLSTPRERFRPLQAKDLTYICIIVAWYLGTAFLALIGELLVDQVTRQLKWRRLLMSVQPAALK